LWLGFAGIVSMTLAFVDGGDAQPPGKKGKGFGQAVTVDQIVERIMSFDKNGDGKITIDELPERMHHLMALGDLNKDGALDKEEIRKLATTIESFASLTGGGGPGQKGGGPKGGGPKGPAGEVQRAIDDLDLRGKNRDKAQAVASAHQEKLRRFEELTRAEVIMQMKDVLNEDDYRAFKSTLDRGPFQKGGPKGFDKGGPKGFGGPKEPDLNRRIDQLQKELDELRAKVSK
jgi:hypothetical protein